MHTPELNEPAAPSRLLPSWILSVVFHAALIVLLGWYFASDQRGLGTPPGRPVGIVLKQVTAQGEFYEDRDDLEQAREDSVIAQDQAQVLAALPTDAAEFEPSSVLPADDPLFGMGAVGQEGLEHVGDLTSNLGQRRPVKEGYARVSVYGLEGEGRKFAYVFDRSSSMDGPPLASAKAELLQSLEGLESTHQFQILFFNHQVRTFDLSGGQKRIPFADERSKAVAKTFVSGIRAVGGTDRMLALESALGFQPDVIFFLSDVDDPLSQHQLEQIRRRNQGISTIHTIEFGIGPSDGEDNFLKQIARQSGGQFTYVDTLKLGK